MNSQAIITNSTQESNPRKTVPPGKFGRVMGMLIFLCSLICVGWVVSMGKTEQAQFHSGMSELYIPGIDLVFGEQGDGVVANVALDMGWEKTPLFRGMEVQDRRLVASFLYLDVDRTAKGAADIAELVMEDVEMLVGGDVPESFSNLSHTSFFSFMGNMAVGGPVLTGVLVVGLVMMGLLLGIGRKDIVLHTCGCLMGMVVLLLALASYLVYSGDVVFVDITTTEIPLSVQKTE